MFSKKENIQNNSVEEKKFSFVDLLARIFRSPMSIDEVAQLFSKDIDSVIVDEIKAGRKYVGGIFEILLVDDRNFTMGYQLYFEDNKGKYFNKTASSEKTSLEYLNEESQKELIKAKKISFEIEPPKVD